MNKQRRKINKKSKKKLGLVLKSCCSVNQNSLFNSFIRVCVVVDNFAFNFYKNNLDAGVRLFFIFFKFHFFFFFLSRKLHKEKHFE